MKLGKRIEHNITNKVVDFLNNRKTYPSEMIVRDKIDIPVWVQTFIEIRLKMISDHLLMNV